MVWYVTRDGKLWQECFSRREARYVAKYVQRQFPESVIRIVKD